jgi:hypothetical protein
VFGIDITKGEDHTQGLARTQLLSDGSIYWFLSYSDIGGAGSVSQYRYDGGLDGEHVAQTSPLTVAPMIELFDTDGEPHPSDITFLPDVNGADAGYLFVTEEYDLHLVAVYAWAAGHDMVLVGRVGLGGAAIAAEPSPTAFPTGGPNFLFIDLVGDQYLLGIASNNWGHGYLFTAEPANLFPSATPGQMDVSAFTLVGGTFAFPLLGGPCQCKLVRDSTGAWSLLGFRSCQGPWGSPRGRSWNLPAGGRQFFPVAASGSPRVRGAYRSPLSVSSAAATGSSQQGQVPPRPAARMNRLHSGHLCSPSVRRSQSSQT